MAELVLKVGTSGPDPAYQDGDIIHAFTRRAIRCVHSEHICHLKNFGYTPDGLRPDSLAKMWREKTHKYRFERVSRTEIKRTDLATLAEDVLGPTMNTAREQIDVPQFIERQLRDGRHCLFGTPGREVWYGGHIDISHARLNLVWAEIEARTAFREMNFPRWPLSLDPMILPLPVTDMSDERAELLTKEEWHEDPVPRLSRLIRRRNYSVAWRALPSSVGLTVTEVLDPSRRIDLRRIMAPFINEVIVQRKP